MSRYAWTICGGDTRPAAERESTCPNALHDWPLPSGYTDAAEEADRRIARRWNNSRCPDCGLYGWRPSTTAEHYAAQTFAEPSRRALTSPPTPATGAEKP